MNAVIAVVPSETVPDRTYEITRASEDRFVCSCQAFSFSRATPATCKHILAWELAQTAPADATPLHTFTGRAVYPLTPRLEDIAIEDIAHALAQQCRYGGHLRDFYSVAQHAVLVSQLCDPIDALHGLLHDGSEAYLVDIPRPLKYLPAMDGYRSCEAVWQALIYRRFRLRAGIPPSVKKADDAILVNEAQDLFAIVPAWAAAGVRIPHLAPIVGWTPREAERLFLAKFRELRRVSSRR